MEQTKRERLESQGWSVGSAYDFLEMTEEEASYVELKLILSNAVRHLRKKKKMTQKQLAERLQSSQSRVAKVEAGDQSVSLDLLIRSLLVMGASRRDLAGWLTAAH